MLELTPAFSLAAAQRIARERFGRSGTAHPLPSERDQNFLIDDAPGAFVLKIANATEHRALLEAQQHVLGTLAAREIPVPRVLCAGGGESIIEVSDDKGRQHLAWGVTRLPGIPLASVRHRPALFLEDVGRMVGRLTSALNGVQHAALAREFHWDLTRGAELVGRRRDSIQDDSLGAALDAVLAMAREHIAPVAIRLPRAPTHNDLNDHNILVGGNDDRAVFDPPSRVTGIVDFGDMVIGWRIADLAIAAAYAMLDAPDPLAVLGALVRGASAEIELDDAEIAALYALACMRLALSACIAVEQRLARPENEYLGVSQQAIRRTLPRLVSLPYALAVGVARAAAGREPVAHSARVRTWLMANQRTFASVLPMDLRREPSVVLDLGVGSPLVSGNAADNTEPRLTARIDRIMREGNVRVAVGRYDEPRLLYTAPFFAGTTDGSERRTVHIGLDLFAPAGTPVHAPIDGVVHHFANNAVLQDYGPVIILRHETDAGDSFYTLYGHLSRTSLEGLAIGRRIRRGERFAWLGDPDENVGWTPHLHLQIVTDLLGLGTDFPGVAPASQRAVWRSLSPDPNLIVGVPASRFPAPEPEPLTTVAERRVRFGGNLSIAYRAPVKVERGWMQFLYDDTGRRLLDAYNNVPHVGHCHPRVVRAGQAQMAVLNTNTRYPSDLANRYAEALTGTLPEPLRSGVTYLVNSASEANELALRLARSATGERDVIVLESAYHGNTSSLIDISPYKHGGPGGAGRPDWVQVAMLPDDYRGPYKRSDTNAGSRYALDVGEAIGRVRAQDRGVAAFIAETCPSVGGQIILPPGYLAAVYAHVRRAGGICIADEVQTGLGRMGTHFWAFEAQQVVPDIVVMGKPLGNGHPIGAVVCRRDIAAAFDNGMEYFSTFGGNQVSCAIGLAVLEVLRDEALQEHARVVGERMLAGLRPFIDRHLLVGDVRGSGLFLGVELVRNRDTLEPGTAEASYVANRMREEGILLGTDGPHHNVVKIRPPMPFTHSDADRLVEMLDEVLKEACVIE
jgi:4-aminobutyrate aminotransferase-like enzyme/Ser/Thr protein kinase RdoA (MazF antagonist)